MTFHPLHARNDEYPKTPYVEGEGTGSAVCGGACPHPEMGTGARKKGASPPQYVSIAPTQPRRTRMRALSRGRATSLPAWLREPGSHVRRHRACEVDSQSSGLGARGRRHKLISGFVSAGAVEAVMDNVG